CAAAVFAACGASNGNQASGTGSSTGGHATGAGSAGSTGGEMSSSANSSGGPGGGFTFDAGNGMHTLTIKPATATITISSTTAPATQTFKALLDGSPVTGTVAWTLDSYAQGSISPTGALSTTGLVGGTVTVTASYGKEKATAKLTV